MHSVVPSEEENPAAIDIGLLTEIKIAAKLKMPEGAVIAPYDQRGQFDAVRFRA